MCCQRVSSASSTMGCWHRRPKANAWRWRASCWPCRKPTLRRARTRRPSCAAWQPSPSPVARIAGSDDGAWLSSAVPMCAHRRHTADSMPKSTMTANHRQTLLVRPLGNCGPEPCCAGLRGSVQPSAHRFACMALALPWPRPRGQSSAASRGAVRPDVADTSG